MCGNANHQGVVAVAAIKEYADLDDIFQLAQSRERLRLSYWQMNWKTLII